MKKLILILLCLALLFGTVSAAETEYVISGCVKIGIAIWGFSISGGAYNIVTGIIFLSGGSLDLIKGLL